MIFFFFLSVFRVRQNVDDRLVHQVFHERIVLSTMEKPIVNFNVDHRKAMSLATSSCQSSATSFGRNERKIDGKHLADQVVAKVSQLHLSPFAQHLKLIDLPFFPLWKPG
jgi:hypothetical protein